MKSALQRLISGPWPGCVALFIGAALLGFALFFPYETLRSRIEAEAARRGATLSVGAVTSALPLGVTLRDLRIFSPNDAARTVVVNEVRLRPSWLSLMTGSLAVRLDARLYGGEIGGNIVRNGAFDLDGSGVELRIPLLDNGNALLRGKVLRASLLGAYPPTPTTITRIEIVIDGGRLEGLSAFGGKEGVLDLGTLTLRIAGSGPNLRFETLEASGGEVTASGDGTLTLATPFKQSPLNLTLRLRPTARLDPTLASLLTALLPPGGDGSSILRLGGALAAPRKL